MMRVLWLKVGLWLPPGSLRFGTDSHPQTRAQTIAGGIIPDHTNYAGTCPQRDDIGEDVRRTAEVHRLTPNVDDGHRSPVKCA